MDNHYVCVCVGESSVSRMVFSMESEPSEKFWPLIKGPVKMCYHPITKRTLLGNKPSSPDIDYQGFSHLTGYRQLSFRLYRLQSVNQLNDHYKAPHTNPGFDSCGVATPCKAGERVGEVSPGLAGKSLPPRTWPLGPGSEGSFLSVQHCCFRNLRWVIKRKDI